MGGKRTIRVFIGSPRGLEPERRAFKQIVDELNGDFAEALDIEFRALAWEDTLSSAGLRVQTEINKDVARCDVFLLVIDDLWGRKNPDAKIHAVKCLPELAKLRPSNTMEEFSFALKRGEETQSPEVQVLTKKLPVKTYQDTGPEGKQVIRFRKQLDKSGKVLRLEWESTEQFKSLVERILKRFGKPDGGSAVEPPPAPEFGPEFQAKLKETEDELERMRKKLAALERQQRSRPAKARSRHSARKSAEAAKSKLDAAKFSVLELALAERAAQAALNGRLEEARQDFAKALDGTTNVRVLYLGYEFYERTGELDEAERLLKRWLAISGSESESASTAAALGNLGLIERTRGNLDDAEAYHKKSLAIEEKLGRLEGMASDYGNLGVIEHTRGNLDSAEAYHKKSLAIEEKLGRLEGMASEYSSLGLIEHTRGNLDSAEAHHKKSLALNEKLGRLEGMAIQYGNLGLIEETRGNLEDAEAYLKKALALNEQLGRLEGMAIQYGNLGLIEQTRGDLDGAEAYHKQSLAINEKLGRLEGMASVYGNLGLIEQMRGDLDGAEVYLKKSLALDEKLGRLEGMAIQYSNLGRVERTRSNLDEARRLWVLARDLFRKIGAKDREAKVQGWLDGLK